MANSNTAVYAVVDKSKKRQKNSLPAKQIAESTLPNSFDSPVYDATEFSAEALPAPERNEAIDSEYSMITLDNMYSTLNQTNRLTEATNQGLSQATTTKAEKAPKKKRSRNDATDCKTLACIFITIAVMATIMLICIVILSAEVAKLKPETTSMQQSPLGQQTANDLSSFQHQLQQINQNLSSVKDLIQTESLRIEEHLNNSLNRQLNMSADRLYLQLVETYSTQENRIQQLNSSFKLLKLGQENNTQELNSSIQMLRSDVISIEQRTQGLISGQLQASPVSSCAVLKGLLHFFPSGYYWVRASNGSAVRVYCDMTRSCGGVTGGWMRVAELDMTISSQKCPSGLEQHTVSNMRTCRINSSRAACSPVTAYSTILEYSKACGKIRAFKIESTDGFGIHGVRHRTIPISGNYVDGVSLTHGNPKKHIWTFAAGSCPCNNPPQFVDSDYFCDTRTHGVPLWQGANCGNMCCSFNNPPWFFKQLPQPTTDDIEMRVCRDEPRSNEDIEIQGIEIYVQ